MIFPFNSRMGFHVEKGELRGEGMAVAGEKAGMAADAGKMVDDLFAPCQMCLWHPDRRDSRLLKGMMEQWAVFHRKTFESGKRAFLWPQSV